MWSVRVTDGHFLNFQLWMPVKNNWSDVMDWFMIYCEGYHKVSWKSIKFGCHGCLFKWESMKCLLPQSGR